MAFIGVKNLTIFPITKDDGTTTTYGSPVKLAETIKIGITPNVAKGVLHGSDKTVAVSNSLTGYGISVNQTDLTPEHYAQILGSKKDSKGGVTVSPDDEAPYFAVAFESDKHNGKTMYVVLYKVKFSHPKMEHSTKKENIEYTTPEIDGEAIPRQSDNSLIYFIEGSEDNSTVTQAWFTSPQKHAG